MNKLIFIILSITLLSFCSSPSYIHFQGRTMGTTYQVKIVDQNGRNIDAAVLKDEVDKLLGEVNRQMSAYMPNSEISQFNNSRSNEPLKVSKEFVNVLRLALRIHQESQGAFDVTVAPLVDLWGFGRKGMRETPPTEAEINSIKNRIGAKYIQIVNDSLIAKRNPRIELDLGAIAKGYGVDVVARLLQGKGYKNYLVEIGGEVVVKGLNGKDKWKIGVDLPVFGNLPGKNLDAVLHISDAAIATSGDYRNYFVSEDKTYSHAIDPLTCRPIINGVASVTVIAPSCILADAMATAIMVMGAEPGLKWIESKQNIESLIILRIGGQFREIRSSGFSKYIKEES
jgi:thiamine biosynthesis lipoprotein